MQIPIKATLDRIPGGTMVVPLFVGAVGHTVWPSASGFFGSFTGGLLSGAVPLSAAFFVCLGTTLEFRSTGQILIKGGSLLGAKILSALVLGVVAARFLAEPDPAGWVLIGGEDHALLVTFPPDAPLPPSFRRIGTVLPPAAPAPAAPAPATPGAAASAPAAPGAAAPAVLLAGRPIPGSGGWRHFA